MSCSNDIGTMTTDEVRAVSIDMRGRLDSGELLTGTPTIEADGALTISNERVNTGSVVINKAAVGAGLAIQFLVTPSVAGRYSIDAICSTDGGQEVEENIVLVVEESKR